GPTVACRTRPSSRWHGLCCPAGSRNPASQPATSSAAASTGSKRLLKTTLGRCHDGSQFLGTLPIVTKLRRLVDRTGRQPSSNSSVGFSEGRARALCAALIVGPCRRLPGAQKLFDARVRVPGVVEVPHRHTD